MRPLMIAVAVAGVILLGGTAFDRAQPPLQPAGSPSARSSVHASSQASSSHTHSWLRSHVATVRATSYRVHAIASEERSSLQAAPATRTWRTTEASWYDHRPFACFDERGRHEMPSGSLWVAHPSLPCGTTIEVVHGDHSVTMSVWDHGPSARGRDLDLSRAAFARLASPTRGVLNVRWRVVDTRNG